MALDRQVARAAMTAGALVIMLAAPGPAWAAPAAGDGVTTPAGCLLSAAADESVPHVDQLPAPTPAQIAASEAATAVRLAALDTADAGNARSAARRGVTVDLVWHVMRRDKTVEGGNISRTTIKEAVRRSNRHYAGAESRDGADTKIKFRLVDITRTTNEDWYTISAGGDDAMKEATRVGGAETLNVWTGDVDIFAYATLPWDYEDDPLDDGVVVDASFIAAPDDPQWGDRVLTHEVGHWIGLYHTTEGGCSDLDQVDDTPAQRDAVAGCPAGYDSCPDKPGLDPLRNYMGASDNTCANHFTRGQGIRMREQWRAWRAAG